MQLKLLVFSIKNIPHTLHAKSVFKYEYVSNISIFVVESSILINYMYVIHIFSKHNLYSYWKED